MTFRYDINGLRAIAVIAVVLFHFNPAWVPGGFAGVDVFFVISGFLMTGIIFKGLESNNFNLFKFYVARANRIIPALAVLCLVLLILGWFYLAPLDYRELGKHVASSMGFLSNIIYWRESGYFDAASHEKWLLHTWSLSVEWQFYIIYPIVLIALKRSLSLDKLKRLIVIGSALGFVFSVIATVKWPNPTYYLLPTRAWEMMIGGVAFLYPLKLSERRKKATEIVGLLLILSSYAFISSDTPWPGHFALLPVLGAYLMIVANRQTSVITNNKIFQYLGKWSYSIYLWHWPVVVFGYYFDPQGWYLYGLLLSVFLGFTSFRFIESFDFKSFYQWFKVKSTYIALLIGSLGLCIFLLDGFVNRVDEKLVHLTYFKDFNAKLTSLEVNELNVGCDLRNMDERCQRLSLTPRDDIGVIILGDSHADYGFIGVYDSYVRSGGERKVVSAGASGCLPVLFMRHRAKSRDGCGEYMESVYRELEFNHKEIPIVILSRFNLYPFGFNEKGENNLPYMYLKEKIFNDEYAKEFRDNMLLSFCKLTKNNDVHVLRPLPEFKKNTPNIMLKGAFLNSPIDIKLSISDHKRRSKFINETLDIAAQECGINLIDASENFEVNGYYYASQQGVPLFVDDNHLSIFGAKSISNYFDYIWN